MSLTTVSSKRISPEVTDSSPTIILSVDDLPHPEGPSSETNSPSEMLSEKSLTACTLPRRLR